MLPYPGQGQGPHVTQILYYRASVTIAAFFTTLLWPDRDNGFVAGQAALKAESSKVAKHEKTCLENQHVFIPFAFDTFGFLAPEVDEFLNRVQRVVQSYDNECDFLHDNPQCQSGGSFYYLEFFYCDCVNYAFFGYVSLGVWLLALFYLLGNTSADYFCCCLEKLSNVLGLAPTVAGVTLLPLGNGAPDVFASIASFVGTENANVGLNSISGGAVFIICVVVGTISLYVANQGVTLDKNCFVRDVCTFLFAVVILGVDIVCG
ncbi:cation/calcium exchanger 4-like protein [Tanacetum coccineum]